MMAVKTHVESKRPRISVSRLADYMAASEQARRSIIRSCKYRSVARVVQHDEAKAIIAGFLCAAIPDAEELRQRVEAMEARFYDNQFDSDVNGHNCDYVRRFISVSHLLEMPDAVLRMPDQTGSLDWHGTRVTFYPDVLISRITRRNTVKTGALMLRYSKSKALAADVGIHQSALIFGYIRECPLAEASAPEKALCITLDAYAGVTYEAPSNSIYLCKEMAAACATIAERWNSIKPPPGAVM
jgi:hypothetical protein